MSGGGGGKPGKDFCSNPGSKITTNFKSKENYMTPQDKLKEIEETGMFREAEDTIWLIARVKELEGALEKCCAPESDGFGSFVDEEFEHPSVLEGRKVLKGSK